HPRRHQDDLAATDQITAAEAEVDRATGNAGAAFEPLAELGAAHEFGRQRYRGMRPADAGSVTGARAHHHVGHRHQQPAVRPAHGIAVARLERQTDPQALAFDLEPQRADQADEVVADPQLAKSLGNELVHAGNPSLEAASFSSATRTTGSNGVLRCVSSL